MDEPPVPCDLIHDLWIHEIVQVQLEHFACLTRVALRLVSKWFHAHVPAPIRDEVGLRNEFRSLVELPHVSPLLCWDVRHDVVPGRNARMPLSLYGTGMEHALLTNRLPAFYALHALHYSHGGQLNTYPAFNTYWKSAMASRHVACVKALWFITSRLTYRYQGLVWPLLREAMVTGQAPVFNWLVYDVPLQTWFTGGTRSHSARLVSVDSADMDAWLQYAQDHYALTTVWLLGWVHLVQRIITAGPRTNVALRLKRQLETVEAWMRDNRRGQPMVV